jgi:hypothetical protein
LIGRPPRAKDTGYGAAGKSAPRRFAGRGVRNKSDVLRFERPAYKRPRICYGLTRAKVFQPGAREIAMAKGQMRSNKEKKKPKADKNLKKGGATPSPFSSGKTPAGQSPNSKK